MADEPEEAIDRLIAALDRLSAATLAAALIDPTFPAQKVNDTFHGVLEHTIHDDRKLKAMFDNLKRIAESNEKKVGERQ
jgi:hypothetical protein